MTKKLTFLLTPTDAFGQINPFIGIGQKLQSCGHRVVFGVDSPWKDKLVKYGFEEELIIDPRSLNKEASEDIITLFSNSGLFKEDSPLEKFKQLACGSIDTFERTKLASEQFKTIIEKIKPNIIITDNFVVVPSIVTANIPWVQVIPCNPLFNIQDNNVPPGFLGLPSNDKTNWHDSKEEIKNIFQPLFEKLNSWMEPEYGIKLTYPYNLMICSPFLVLYQYPKELDYVDLWTPPDNWHRFDSFMRFVPEKFQLPENLKSKSGKLIYFSMGSIGSANVDMMKRLTEILGKLPYRFIVSKGVFADKYDLPDNCWGESMVSQTKILPNVDLAIIHGGNNSLCESFYFGKPVIVMPTFCDQFDNAQRVEETGFGIKLNPYSCTKEELLNAIESLLNNNELILKMKTISERAQTESSSNRLVELIQGLIK